MRSPKLIMPQQIRAYAPPIIGGVIAGGWDKGEWRTLNLDTLVQLWRLSETIQPAGKLDTRNTITATLAATAVIGDIATAVLTVPAGELWFIQALQVVSPAQTAAQGQIVTVNFRISSWPDDDGTSNAAGKLFWATAKGTVDVDTYWAEFHDIAPLFDVENLRPSLRLVGGDKITLYATLTAVNCTAALAATLTPYGYKATLQGV